MIDAIGVSNLALIEEAEIEPSRGLTAITGETGAGKTALLASCKLLMGQRADKNIVREGTQECLVQGAFSAPDNETEVVVRRSVSADGRSRAKINGVMASATELSEEIAPFVGLCSQHDYQLLVRPATQRLYLDMWADTVKDGALDAYQQAFHAFKEAQHKLDEVRAHTQASSAKIEDAAYKLAQIDAVGPDPQEYEELLSTFKKSENADLLARVTGEAHYALSEEGGVLDNLNAAIALLEEGMRADESLAASATSLRDALYTIEDVARDVSQYRDAIDLDEASFAALQERIAAYQSLMRSYGPTIEEVIAHACEAREILAIRDNAEEVEREAQKRLECAQQELTRVACVLSEARTSAIPSFEEAINNVLAELEMGSARVEVDIERLPDTSWTAEGPDAVAFLFRPGQGMQPRPLSKIASGGELSRVMCALHVAMGERDNTATLVFDEIDAGVGGSAALSLGSVLAELATTHQVIVVTHLPQIAARAEKHYVATKMLHDGNPATTIACVEGEDRMREIARMLSGSVTEASLEHARELLAL